MHNETKIKNMSTFVMLKKLKLQKIESKNSWSNATISKLKKLLYVFLVRGIRTVSLRYRLPFEFRCRDFGTG